MADGQSLRHSYAQYKDTRGPMPKRAETAIAFDTWFESDANTASEMMRKFKDYDETVEDPLYHHDPYVTYEVIPNAGLGRPRSQCQVQHNG